MEKRFFANETDSLFLCDCIPNSEEKLKNKWRLAVMGALIYVLIRPCVCLFTRKQMFSENLLFYNS